MIDNRCSHCGSRIWYTDEPGKETSRRYSTPWGFRRKLRKYVGYYPFTDGFYITKCEVCQRKMAIFDRTMPAFKIKYGDDMVAVLYFCSLDTEPLDINECNNRISCRGCKAKKKAKDKNG